ncbi:hypothetical protein, conserved [Babesia ovata]|uniref:C3H1-type domain-containing protein n=1 Tax=Babesia ovata TaxID=189622 RepID=A0A2H6KJ53_9APIC|nr:uncharacterized protein BOVATA_045170 [Babesia ovata]GBE63024.1 hypothetical protein, conserved [Babesia ovata]
MTTIMMGETLDDIDARRISLGTLAGQLSGLIGGSDEVKNAILYGLHSNVSQLEKLLEASCGGEGCCKDAGEAINNLNEFNEKLKKHLNEEPIAAENLDNILSDCKLNPSDGPLDKLNKEITQKIDDLTRQIDELKNDNNDVNKSKNASEIDKLNKDLQSHNASKRSLETLNGLCEIAEKIDQKSDNTKNLLNNLCGGLEKFLGYQDGNYTGEGIVYSDLDRLCDGVMAFLHSVLKDVHAKQPYNVGKEGLNDVISKLFSNLCSGYQGFQGVITEVAAGVERYNREVERSNDKIKTPITRLQEQVNDDFKKRVSDVLNDYLVSGTKKTLSGKDIKKVEDAVEQVNDLLKRCQENAAQFNEALNTDKQNIKDAINDLNPNLRDKVNKARDTIKLETEQLTALTSKQKTNLDEMVARIKTVLEELGTCVNKKIREKVTELVNNLKKKVEEIKRQLESIKRDLTSYVEELRKWMEDAKKFIDEVKKYVKKELEEKNVGKNIREKINTLATTDLDEKKDTLDKYIRETKEAIKKKVSEAKEQKVGELTKWKNAAEAVIEKAQGKCTEILKRVDESTGGSDVQIKKQAELLQNKAKDLLDAYSQAHGKVEQLPKQVEDAVADLHKVYNEKLKTVNKEVIAAVKTALNGSMDTLDELDNHVKRGLLKIRERIETEVIDAYVRGIVSKVMEAAAANDIGGVGGMYAGAEKLRRDADLQKLGSLGRSLYESASNGNQKELEIILFCVNKAKEQWNGIKSGSDLAKILTDDIKAELKKIIKGDQGGEKYKAEIKFTKEGATGPDKELMSDYKKQTEKKGVNGVDPMEDGKLRQKIDAIKDKVNYMKSDRTEEVNVESFQGYNNAEPSIGINGKGAKAALTSATANVKTALSDFHNMSAFKDMPEFEGHTGLQTELAKGTIENSKKAVTAHFSTITDELQAIAHFVDKKTPAPSGQSDNDNGIQDWLTELKEKGLKSEETWTPVTDQTSKGLLKIKDEIDKALTVIENEVSAISVGVTTKALEDLSTKIKENLDTLAIELYIAGKSINEKLENFKVDKIGTKLDATKALTGTLQQIHQDFNTLLTVDVEKVIQAADEFIRQAPGMAEKTISSLKFDVEYQVKTATEKLTTEARKHYISTIKLQLEQFAARMAEHLKGLPEAIEKDKHIGFKGLMEKLESKPEKKPVDKHAYIIPKPEQSGMEKLKTAVMQVSSSPEQKKAAFKTLADAFPNFVFPLYKYFLGEIKRVHDDNMSKHNPPRTDEQLYGRHLIAIFDSFDALLRHLKDTNRFDHKVPGLLNMLSDAVNGLKPDGFYKNNTPVIDCVPTGLTDFVKELKKVYISAYDRQPFNGPLTILDSTKNLTDQQQPTDPVYKLTDEGRDCAKVFMSMLEILNEDMKYLKKQCKSEWASRTIYSGSSLGTFLSNCGYIVPKNEKSQDGELRYNKQCDGKYIYDTLLVGNFPCLFDADKNAKRAFETVYEYLQAYYVVCHVATSFSKKRPCSIYEMLAWCTSLLHHPVYFDLTTNDFGYLFDEPKKKEADSMEFDGISLEEPSSLSLAAYPQKIAQSEIHDAIVHVTSLAPVILTTIVGYGDEFTTYAVDYRSNALNFTFPSSAGECLNMLLEFLRRMMPVFRFLHHQCTNLVSEHGWYSCKYGKDVKSAKWPCSDHSNSKPNCQAMCQPNCQPNSKPNCQPTSPLMSYLNDCLPGHLPHQLVSVGCKSICSTCPRSKPGMPCLTPLGFRGFSGSTKTGKDLCKVLTNFFGNGVTSPLLSVAPKPPSNLAEHFQFALSFVKGWSYGGSNGLKTVIENSAKSVSINLYDQPTKLTAALTNAYRNTHSKNGGKDHLTAYADVSSLAMTPACDDRVGKALCAPYVASLCGDTYAYFAEKHCNTYLSWAIYLPWTFWDLLNNLYNAFCGITCADWGCRGCLRGDKCRSGKHGVVEDEKKTYETCQCTSIVACRGVAPTLYQYGFSFGEASTLNDEDARKGALEDIDARRISLGQLAGQLSGLIGGSEDVKNAILNGLHSNERLAEIRCNDHRDQINTLNEKLNKLKNKLKDDQNTPVNLTVILSKCKLNGLDGPLKELKDAITEKIEKLNKDIESLKKADKDAKQRNETPQNASEIDKLNKDLQSHEASKKSLDTLNELCGYADKINKKLVDENPSTEILKSLCGGLEKFLGYDNGNYTGEGIVYSDIDRLCDGVMAFLHGVFNEVYKNDNLSPYKTTLDAAVKALETHRYEGKTGLRDVIDSVKEGIAGWLEAVTLSNKKVTGPLEKLLNGTDEDKISKLLEKMNTMKDDKKLEYKENSLEDWIKNVSMLYVYSDRSFDKLNNLDQNLQKELSPHVSLIKDRVDTFVDSTKQDHEGLVKVCGRVDERMSEIINHVDMISKGVEEKIGKITAMLNSEINALQEHIRKVVPGVESAIKELDGWVKDEDFSKSKLLIAMQKCEDIVRLLKADDNPLKKQFDAIEQARQTVDAVHTALRGIDEDLLGWINKAEPLVRQSIPLVTAILNEVNGKNVDTKYPDGITTAAEKLKEDALKLEQAMREAHGYISGRVGDALGAVEKQLRTAVNKDLKRLRNEITAIVGTYFDALKMAEFSKADGDGNVTGLETFSKQFQGWLREVKKSKIRKRYITGIGDGDDAFQRILYVLDALRNKDLSIDNKMGFDAMGDDAEWFIGESFGREDAEVTGDDDFNPTENYDGEGGKDSVTGPLSLIESNPDGLRKIQNIEGSDNNNITPVSLGQLHEKITSSLQFLIKMINEKADNEKSEGLKQKLQLLEILIINSTDGNKVEGQVGLQKIKSDLTNQKKMLSPQSHAIQQAVQAVQEQLTKISEMVEKKTEKDDGVKDHLGKLKSEMQRLQKSLMELKVGDLTTEINTVQRDFTAAKSTIRSYIQSITREVKHNANMAGRDIKRHALSQFAVSKARALEQLKELVEEESAKIEYLISLDKMAGLKGFMKIFKEKFVEKVKNIETSPTAKLKDGADKLHEGFANFFEALGNEGEELKQHSNVIRPDALFPEPSIYGRLYDPLKILLHDINDSGHINYNFSDHLESLNAALSTFTPAKFTDSSSPILQALKDGIGALAKQLGYAYVSTYCCRKFDGALLDPQDPTTSDDKRKLTEYGKQLSKVFMTCIPGWARYLYDLQRNCSGEWSQQKIHTPDDSNKMALWFHSRGFTVPEDDKKQNGHMKRGMTGEQINSDIFTKELTKASQMKIKIKGRSNDAIYLMDILSLLHPTLERYRKVCHYYIPPKPRAPSNIYNMLQWTAGLKYNHMYGEVKSQLGSVLKGLQKEHKLEKTELPVAVPYDMQRVIQSPINSAQLTNALDNVCYFAGETLVAVLGHGHADGVYASDHLTNSSNLLYPGSGGACLDMLVDVLFRLYQQLWFLCRQCLGDKSHSGWKDCSYGRYVSGSGWQCNDKQCPNQECKLSANQKVNQNPDQTLKQTADQRCDQHPDCGMKSPLQSFLEDGLQGFLPHSFSTPGCKLTCTVSNHRGLPCKTPMGFADIGVLASHTKTGAYLEGALYNFCGPKSHLSKLCNMLNCVLRRAPQTLDDIFGFFRGYLAHWIDAREHKISAFNKAIREAYFGKEYPFDPTSISYTRNHSHHMQTHSKGDLFTISECEGSAVDTCGVYVESLSSSTYSIFSSYHNKQYLSWILYSAETLYNMLDRLYKQCCGTCTSPGAKCHGTRCDKECEVKKAYDAQKSDDATPESKSLNGKNHTENCTSIVRCQNTLPTLYMYGFSFGKPLGLCGTGDALEARRTCKDFCSALKKILEEESALIQLIKQIDEFIWKIRENFSYTLLALWSLSLLYLLHIAVVRLDVLRIRSHLRSPSSHRIAAQSLLAAARFKALANVKYFSP